MSENETQGWMRVIREAGEEMRAKKGQQSSLAVPIGSAVERKAFICKNCGSVYADEPVTECDCKVGGIHEFYEGTIRYIEQQNSKR